MFMRSWSRHYHKSLVKIPLKLQPVESEARRVEIYHAIMDKPDSEFWSVTDLINKGFALLIGDRYKYKYVIDELFQEAKVKDIHHQYTEIIESGLQQAKTMTLAEQYAFPLSTIRAVTKEEIADNIKVLEEASRMGNYY